MTLTQKDRYFARNNRWNVLKEIKRQREARKKTWAHMNVAVEIMASNVPGVLFSLTGGNWFAPTIVAERNSADFPREYAKMQYVLNKDTYSVSIKDFTDKKGKLTYRSKGEASSMYEVLVIFKHAIANINKLEGYKPEKDKRKLINVTETKDGYLTVAVMKRDDKGRFMPEPVVERYHDTFNLGQFLGMQGNNLKVIRYNPVKRQMIEVDGQIFDTK